MFYKTVVKVAARAMKVVERDKLEEVRYKRTTVRLHCRFYHLFSSIVSILFHRYLSPVLIILNRETSFVIIELVR